jgi:hypothetical protein
MPAPDQLQKGHTFIDGDTVNGALLNSIVDEGIVLSGAITEQTALVGTADPTDLVQVYDVSATALRKATFSQFPSVNSVSLVMPTTEFDVTNTTVAGVATLTAAWKTTIPLQKFLASPVASSGAPIFRDLTAPDLTLPPVNIALATIDWSNGNLFVKVLTGPITFAMAGISDGQSITVLVSQSGAGNFTVAWPTIRWPGGAAPIQSPTTNHADIYQFWSVGGVIFGNRVATNLS